MNIPLGHTVKPPTCNPDALFGPSHYTLAQQAANPDQPMTRVVKDILLVGRWNIDGPDGGEFWTADQATLVQLARSFAAKQDAGHSTNLTLSHGDENMDIETDDLVAPIDAVRADGDTLWMALYVTPRQAKFLTNPAIKVSVGTINDYEDGGNKFVVDATGVTVGFQRSYSGYFDEERPLLPVKLPEAWQRECDDILNRWGAKILERNLGKG